MSLGAGTRLGPYEIGSLLGVGGMGEVYRARDPRLGREVAIKVLPPAFSADSGRLHRFEQEARAAAALNHPNILAVYDIGQHEGAPYIVSELLEGGTLRERLASGAVPVRKAVEYAVQIAHGLAAAHEKGITHRDLKPDNIFVTADSRVKILDFGLAKLTQAEPSAAAMSALETTPPNTQEGLVLGTVGYMAPEQVRGLTADPRADIFAFGTVLYEMLSGRRAFSGDTSIETMHAILKAETPELATPASGIPPALERIVRYCLEKDRNGRFQSAHDVALALETLSGQSTSNAGLPLVATRRGFGRMAVAAALALALMIASYAAGVWQSGSDVRAIEWNGELLGGPAVAFNPRVSPDGQMLAFQAMVAGQTQVGIMRLQSGQWTILTDDRTRGIVQDVAWSPDGSSVYFDRFLDVPRGVFRVQVLGGEPRLVLDQAMTPEPLPDGSLVVVRLNEERQRQMFRFWPETGRLEALNGIVATTTLKPAVRASPDGREILFFGQPLDGPKSRDHLYQIDLASGAPRRLAEATSFGQNNWMFPLAVTRDGAEALVDIASGDLHRIVALPRSGSGPPRTLLALTGRPVYIDIGNDGGVYAALVEQPTEILISDATARDPERLVISNASTTSTQQPLPLPDGRILMTIQTAGRNRVMAFARGGTSSPLFETPEETSAPMALVGRETVALVLGSAPNQAVALASTSDGRIVRRLDTIAASGIRSVAGSPDGRTLYYAASGQVSAIDLETGASRVLHPGEAVAIDPAGNYAVVAVREQSGIRLVKVSLADGRTEEIPNRSEFEIPEDAILPNAIGRDGRIAVRIAVSWFWPTGILDPRTGRIDRAWPEIDADMLAGWAEDGRLIAEANFTNSRLWRFVPRTP